MKSSLPHVCVHENSHNILGPLLESFLVLPQLCTCLARILVSDVQDREPRHSETAEDGLVFACPEVLRPELPVGHVVEGQEVCEILELYTLLVFIVRNDTMIDEDLPGTADAWVVAPNRWACIVNCNFRCPASIVKIVAGDDTAFCLPFHLELEGLLEIPED
jgi:hypothetical protein